MMVHTMREYINTHVVQPGVSGEELMWAMESAVRERSRKGVEAVMALAADGPWERVPEKGASPYLVDTECEEVDEIAAYAAVMPAGVRMAAAAGWSGGVRQLLAGGALPDVADAEGNTALMCAAQAGSAECVRMLLAAGAQAEAANAKGKTALMYAARADAPAAVQALLEAGANGAARDARGYSAFMHAAEQASPQVMRLLLPGAPADEVHACSAQGWTLLSLAAMYNAADSVQLLLDLGAGVNTPGKYGMTPLMCAVHRGVGGAPVLHTLLAAGANPHQTTPHGDTAYTLAEQSDYTYALHLFHPTPAHPMPPAAHRREPRT